MNYVPPQAETSVWSWQKPSFARFVKSLLLDAVDFLRHRGWQKWVWYVRWALYILLPLSVLAIYAYRYVWEPYVLFVPRIYSGAITLVLLCTVGGWLGVGWLIGRLMPSTKRLARFLKPVGAMLGLALILTGAKYGTNLHTYFSQYNRYETLHPVEPDRNPTTAKDRTWALHSIFSFVQGRMADTEGPNTPNLVRDGDQYSWTMGVEPASVILQFKDNVEEVIEIPSTAATIDLQRGKNANFDTGENLLFSRNVYTCVKRSLWFWQTATYEVAPNLIYMRNDAGKEVQVVSLIRWDGIAFPRPEFGGVYVIEQAPKNRSWLGERLQTLKRVFWGCGSRIAPDEVAKHKYLVGQNIVPYEVTRYMAASTRFREGLLAPSIGRKEGDIRIPDLPDDVNQQPFTLHFEIWMHGKVVASKLFHYFALEPEAEDKRALVTSFLYPADGIGPPYIYWHFGRKYSCAGVSGIAGYVRSSKRNYDWSINIPVEHRPYLRDIADANGVVKPRWMWLTTIVSVAPKVDKPAKGVVDPKADKSRTKEGHTGAPEFAITDCRHTEDTVWVNRHNPNLWPQELQKALGSIWAKETN